MKKYRINESELFNLESMREHLMCMADEMKYGDADWDDSIFDRIEEIESLFGQNTRRWLSCWLADVKANQGNPSRTADDTIQYMPCGRSERIRRRYGISVIKNLGQS